MSLVIVSENKKRLDEKYNPLTAENIQEIIEHRDVFIKLLKECKLNYQIELMKGWDYRGKEENLYAAIDTINHVVTTIENVHDTLKIYNQALADEKEKKKAFKK